MAGGGAAAAALAERLSRTLGTGVALSARARWTELRASRIAEAALVGLLGPADQALDNVEAEAGSLASICDQWAAGWSWEPGPVEDQGVANPQGEAGA